MGTHVCCPLAVTLVMMMTEATARAPQALHRALQPCVSFSSKTQRLLLFSVLNVNELRLTRLGNCWAELCPCFPLIHTLTS